MIFLVVLFLSTVAIGNRAFTSASLTRRMSKKNLFFDSTKDARAQRLGRDFRAIYGRESIRGASDETDRASRCGRDSVAVSAAARDPA